VSATVVCFPIRIPKSAFRNRLGSTSSAKSASIKGHHERLTRFFSPAAHALLQAKESPHDSLSLLPPEAIYETQGIFDSNNARLLI
jgi:hypothetical protein